MKRNSQLSWLYLNNRVDATYKLQFDLPDDENENALEIKRQNEKPETHKEAHLRLVLGAFARCLEVCNSAIHQLHGMHL